MCICDIFRFFGMTVCLAGCPICPIFTFWHGSEIHAYAFLPQRAPRTQRETGTVHGQRKLLDELLALFTLQSLEHMFYYIIPPFRGFVKALWIPILCNWCHNCWQLVYQFYATGVILLAAGGPILCNWRHNCWQLVANSYGRGAGWEIGGLAGMRNPDMAPTL